MRTCLMHSRIYPSVEKRVLDNYLCRRWCLVLFIKHTVLNAFGVYALEMESLSVSSFPLLSLALLLSPFLLLSFNDLAVFIFLRPSGCLSVHAFFILSPPHPHSHLLPSPSSSLSPSLSSPSLTLILTSSFPHPHPLPFSLSSSPPPHPHPLHLSSSSSPSLTVILTLSLFPPHTHSL